MAITIHKYTPENRQEWQDFLKKSNNGTMFHDQDFLDYHPEGRFDFYHLMIRKDGKLVALLPGGLKENGTVFWSPVGASYGSFVTEDIPFGLALEIVDATLEYFRVNNFKDIYLIPPPFMYYLNYNQHLEYAMLYRKFDYELHYISHAVDLKWGDDFMAHFDKTARKTIHKILREGRLRIEDSNDYDTFYKILMSNKEKKHAKPTHSLEDLYKLRELMPQNLKMMLVYDGDKPIAGSLLFLCNSKVVLCFYNMLYYEYEAEKPVYLIMYETVRWAIENGYEWVDIGVSQIPTDPDPMTPSLNLIYFKERFASRGLLRSTYHYKFKD